MVEVLKVNTSTAYRGKDFENDELILRPIAESQISKTLSQYYFEHITATILNKEGDAEEFIFTGTATID
jgi:hypothetical protein